MYISKEEKRQEKMDQTEKGEEKEDEYFILNTLC